MIESGGVWYRTQREKKRTKAKTLLSRKEREEEVGRK